MVGIKTLWSGDQQGKGMMTARLVTEFSLALPAGAPLESLWDERELL